MGRITDTKTNHFKIREDLHIYIRIAATVELKRGERGGGGGNSGNKNLSSKITGLLFNINFDEHGSNTE